MTMVEVFLVIIIILLGLIMFALWSFHDMFVDFMNAKYRR